MKQISLLNLIIFLILTQYCSSTDKQQLPLDTSYLNHHNLNKKNIYDDLPYPWTIPVIDTDILEENETFRFQKIPGTELIHTRCRDPLNGAAFEASLNKLQKEKLIGTFRVFQNGSQSPVQNIEFAGRDWCLMYLHRTKSGLLIFELEEPQSLKYYQFVQVPRR